MGKNKCKCPVCGIEAFEESVITRFAKRYYCNRCGEFILDDDVSSLFSDTEPGPKLKASLFWYLRTNENNALRVKPTPLICSYNCKEGIEGNYQFISTKYILNLFPNSINDQINMILTNIAGLIGFIGGEIIVDFGDGKECFPIFFIDVNYDSFNAQKQLNEKINILSESGLLKQTSILGDNQVAYTLKTKAWDIVQEIQSKMIYTSQAFIAMWFDDSMHNARDKIRQAISDCGYLPVLIDEKEYNSFIVPEILYEIQKSRFLVADFTGDRGGVYFEAGYAKGLNKDVIMTCKDGYFNPHFDTKQINHIVWKNEEELYERLVKRIRSTVGIV